MSEEYVSKTEFNLLKEEVNDIKKDMDESQRLLLAIDKKIDIINEKILTSDKIDKLTYTPLEKRVETLEDNQKWLRRSLIGEVLTIIGGAIVYVIKIMEN